MDDIKEIEKDIYYIEECISNCDFKASNKIYDKYKNNKLFLKEINKIMDMSYPGTDFVALGDYDKNKIVFDKLKFYFDNKNINYEIDGNELRVLETKFYLNIIDDENKALNNHLNIVVDKIIENEENIIGYDYLIPYMEILYYKSLCNIKRYEVEITETLSRTVVVEAKSEHDAYKEVKRQYYNEEIVLDSSDFINYEIAVLK